MTILISGLLTFIMIYVVFRMIFGPAYIFTSFFMYMFAYVIVNILFPTGPVALITVIIGLIILFKQRVPDVE